MPGTPAITPGLPALLGDVHTAVSRPLQGLLGQPAQASARVSLRTRAVFCHWSPSTPWSQPPWQSSQVGARAALPIVPRWRVRAVQLLGVGADQTKMMLLMMMTAAFYVY